MKELIKQLEPKMMALLQNAKSQMEKGNKAAGFRARRISLDIEPMLKLFRKQSLAASQTKE